MGERIVVVIRIYGDIAIFLLLCDHKDSELQSWELVIGESRSVLTQGKIKGYMGQWYAESKKWKFYCGRSSYMLYGAISIFLLFYDHKYTELK